MPGGRAGGRAARAGARPGAAAAPVAARAARRRAGPPAARLGAGEKVAGRLVASAERDGGGNVPK